MVGINWDELSQKYGGIAGANPLGAAVAGGLGAVEALGNALQAPRNAVQTGLGAYFRLLGLSDQNGPAAFQQGLQRIGQSPFPIFPTAMGQLPAPITPIAADVATDPLTYLGMGLPGRGAQAIRAANPQNNQIIEAVARTLGVMNQVDQAAPAAIQAGLAAPFKGLGAIAGRIPAPGLKVLGQAVDPATGELVETPLRQADNLREWALSLSPGSLLKQKAAELVDAVKVLQQRGHNLFGDVAGVEGAQGATPGMTYPGHDIAQKVIAGLEREFYKDVAADPNPLVKLLGSQLIRETHYWSVRAWEQVGITMSRAQQLGLPPEQMVARQQAALAEAFNDITRIQMAGQRLFDELAPQIRARPLPDTIMSAHPSTGVQSPLTDVLSGVADRTLSMNAARIVGKGGRNQATKLNVEVQDNPLDRIMAGVRTYQDKAGEIMSHADRSYALGQNLLGQLAPDFQLPAQLQLQRGIQQHADLLAHEGMGIPPFLADLPPQLQGPMLRFFPEFSKQLNSVRTDLKAADKVVRELWDQYRPGQPFIDPIDPQARGQSLNTFIQSLGLPGTPPEVSDLIGLRQFIQGKLPPSSINRMEQAIQHWPAGDLFSTDPYQLVVDRVIRAHARTLGLSTYQPNAVRDALSFVNDLWKETALLSPSYLVTNAVSGLLFGALKGVNPLPIMRQLTKNIGRMAKGETVYGERVEDTFRSLGRVNPAGEVDLPEGATAAAGLLGNINSVREYVGKGLTASQRAGSARLGALGGALGGLDSLANAPQDASPQERATSFISSVGVGAGAGVALPVVSRVLLRNLGGALETVMRSTALEQATRTTLNQRVPELLQIVQDALNVPTQRLGVQWGAPVQVSARRSAPKVASHAVTEMTLSPGTSQTLLNDLERTGGVIGREPLIDLLVQRGVEPSVARAAARRWDVVVEDAVRSGTAFSDSIHFNYQHANNAEELIKSFSPFATWGMKALPFLGENLATHPFLISTLMAIQNESQRERKAKGLTQRFAGSVETPFADQFWSMLLGRPVKSFGNPTQGLLPFSNLGRSLEGGSNEENPFETLVRLAGGFGFGLNPALDIAARSTGALGQDEAPRGYLRWGEPIKGLTGLLGINRGRGVDLNAPSMQAERAVREKVGGQPVADLTRSAVLKRIDELALQDLGIPITNTQDARVAPYVNAKSQQSGPIWDQAMREVSRERGTRSLVGFGTQFANPQALLSPEEEQIRGARTEILVSRQTTAQLQALVASNPKAAAPPQMVAEIRAAAQQLSNDAPFNGVIPQVVQDALATGTAESLDWVRKKIYERQTQSNPLVLGYSGQGSVEEQQLSNLRAVYNSPAALLERDPAQAQLNPQVKQQIQSLARNMESVPPNLAHLVPRGAVTPNDVVMKYIKNRQDMFRKENPILDAYLTYQQEKGGTGTEEDFFKNYWHKR